MDNFSYITLPGGEQHVTYQGGASGSFQSVRVHGIVTADKLIAAGMALEVYARQEGQSADLILPYFPGARQDKAVPANVGLSVDVYAAIVSSFYFRKLVILDPHSVGVERALFKHLLHPRALEIIPHQEWFLRWIEGQKFAPGLHKFLFPDAGAALKYGQVGAYSPSLSCHKKRDPATGKLSGFEVPSLRQWEDNFVWLVDDICDGGGTFIGIAEQIREEMGNRISLGLAVSHGIFSSPKYNTRMSELFNYIVTTDSVVGEHVYGSRLDQPTIPVQVQPLAPILKEIGINV